MWGDVVPTCGDFVWGDVETLASVAERQKSQINLQGMQIYLASLVEFYPGSVLRG
jgi:hypothetical protein